MSNPRRATGDCPSDETTVAPYAPATEPGGRPVSEARHRRAVHFTAAQSDSLARLLLGRRLVEVFGLRNGTLVATFQGGGYATWQACITTDGRVLENQAAARPDPRGEAEGRLTIVRESDRLHLGTLLPAAPGEEPALPEPGS